MKINQNVTFYGANGTTIPTYGNEVLKSWITLAVHNCKGRNTNKIGTDFLKNHNLCIDLKNKILIHAGVTNPDKEDEVILASVKTRIHG